MSSKVPNDATCIILLVCERYCLSFICDMALHRYALVIILLDLTDSSLMCVLLFYMLSITLSLSLFKYICIADNIYYVKVMLLNNQCSWPVQWRSVM